jgi:shikimate dehydrogenase
MQILAIIGDPIIQAKSPATFGSYFQANCIDAVMVPLHVNADSFTTALKGLRQVQNFSGAVITIPHKVLAFEIAARHGPMAEATGTANVLVPIGKEEWGAEMFDGIGLLTALQKRGIEVAGLDVLLIGAGGAGTAIAVALEKLGKAASISIADPDLGRAATLAAKLEHGEIAPPDPAGYQVIVNASPVGMRTDEVPFEASRCSPGTIVCDAIMDPPKTRLLQEAEANGCVIVEGLEMLQGQVEPLAHFMGLGQKL